MTERNCINERRKDEKINKEWCKDGKKLREMKIRVAELQQQTLQNRRRNDSQKKNDYIKYCIIISLQRKCSIDFAKREKTCHWASIIPCWSTSWCRLLPFLDYPSCLFVWHKRSFQEIWKLHLNSYSKIPGTIQIILLLKYVGYPCLTCPGWGPSISQVRNVIIT